ncbi:MAG: hypothetical protein LBH65_04625 [Desulfovibrio sp.]|nr:hypothetical protein [Desulfovibrio sp.]
MAMDLKALLEQLLAALGGGQPPAPAATDEEPAALTEGPPEGEPEDNPAADGDDFAARLAAHIEAMEDKELAAKLAEAVEAVKASGLSADADPDSENDKPAEDEEEVPPGEEKKEKDKPAMDSKRKYRGVKLDKKTGNITIMATDSKAVAEEIRAGFKAQIEAARDVRPLIGDVDPLAFDSAAGIYRKALELIEKPSKLTDVKALKELCAMACDAKRSNSPAYPVACLANDSGGKLDPAFANLGKIRKA